MRYRSFCNCLAFVGLLVFALSCSNDAQETIDGIEEESIEIPDNVAPDTSSSTDVITYVESKGIVSAEFESVEGTIEWERATMLDGFDGTGYLAWNKADSFSTPGNGILTYSLKISTPGKYQFIWRSRITHGDSQSESNDSWLRFSDASDFFGERDGVLVYPKGTGKTPNPEGSSADGWFKVYMNRVGEWFWRSNTSDNDPHDIFVTFENPGIYSMEVSGRSQFHGLDRFVLFIEGKTLEEAQNAERSEIVRP